MEEAAGAGAQRPTIVFSFLSFFLIPFFPSRSQSSVFTLPWFPFCSSVNLLSLFRFINPVIAGSLPGKLVWSSA